MRPEGFVGPVYQTGLARDLVTACDGTTTVVATAEMHVITDYTSGTLVRELTMAPAVDRLDALIGARAGGGFRKILDLETGAERGSLPYLLLDDVPGATLVSGVAMTIAAYRGDAELEEFRTRMKNQPRLQVADLCAGWQAGGTLLTNLEDGRPPVLPGPVALPVLDDDDPDAWHALDAVAERVDPARAADRRVARRVRARRRVLPRQRDGPRRRRDGRARVHRRHDRRP